MPSDDANPNAGGGSGPSGNPGAPDGQDRPDGSGKKRRRRRRGGKRNRGKQNKAGQDAGKTQPQAASNGDTAPNAEQRDNADAGSDTTSSKKHSPPRSDRERGNDRPDRREHRPGRGRPDAQQAGNAPKARKKRKPRTKQCVHCYTPCTIIHKVKLDHRKQTAFICDICWPTRCVDNPHYEYQGLWNSGRLMRPGQDAAPPKKRSGNHHANAPGPRKDETSNQGANNANPVQTPVNATTTPGEHALAEPASQSHYENTSTNPDAGQETPSEPGGGEPTEPSTPSES